ncbi:MAG: phosphoribosylamine--glycine ligase [Acidobacteria bacterium]|nr:MAG: phosphoribosylamine--glycine ligase [Acidobacteriota bacterium]
MKILVLGGGGREHALCWKLAQSPQAEAVLALPGNDGIAAAGVRCLAGDASDAATVLAAIAAHGIDLTVVGPEAPLAAGIADALRTQGKLVFGPARAAARLESSKVFAKEFMARYEIPTARFAAVDSAAAARRALQVMGGVAVLKADGLAAGKGVVVPETAAEAEAAAEAMLAQYGRLVIEQRLRGPELSVLAICNGEQYLTLLPARDHKRLREGDQGPNTGGMGAICSAALLPHELQQTIEEKTIEPTLAGMSAMGTPFVGVLYCGLMLTAAGPKVLEYNVRFGDPETQAILPCWGGDLAAVLAAAARGAALQPPPAGALAPWGACVVAAAEGYPGTPTRGDAIDGLDAAGQLAGVQIFHAGTRHAEGQWLTHGGRVLAAAASGGALGQALGACYHAFDFLHFRGMQVRRDIGQLQGDSIHA